MDSTSLNRCQVTTHTNLALFQRLRRLKPWLERPDDGQTNDQKLQHQLSKVKVLSATEEQNVIRKTEFDENNKEKPRVRFAKFD